MADAKLPVVKSRGSSHAEVLEESIKKFGDVPVHEAAQHCPVEAWRVWNSSYPRHYTENSELMDDNLADAAVGQDDEQCAT
ncbi:g8054 [Coccomyxa elongata]